MDDKIEDLARARAEARTGVRDAIAPFFSRAHLGDQRAVAIVGIREDGTVDMRIGADPRDYDRLIALLERAKHRLLTE